MIRVMDFVLALLGLIVLLPVMIAIYIIGLFDTGAPLFMQERVGKKQRPFKLIKFRTMSLDTKSVGTHLVNSSSITKLGGFLRKTKLDELPQLINVLKGEMSLVGPRPCLFNQEVLRDEREQRGVFNVQPGITGLAQVNEIDMSTPKLLAQWDQRMIQDMCLSLYFKLLFQTVIGKGAGDRVAGGQSEARSKDR